LWRKSGEPAIVIKKPLPPFVFDCYEMFRVGRERSGREALADELFRPHEPAGASGVVPGSNVRLTGQVVAFSDSTSLSPVNKKHSIKASNKEV